MRRSGWVGIAMAGAVLACRPVVWAQELKIAYVNMAEVFDGYQRTKTSDTELEKRGKQKEAELEARLNDLKKMRQGLELLNDQAKDAKSREIEERTDELQRFRANTARDLRRDRDQLAKEILKEIQQAIQDYAKTNGFSLVIDERSVLYGQPTYDATQGVLQLLNSRSGTTASASH